METTESVGLENEDLKIMTEKELDSESTEKVSAEGSEETVAAVSEQENKVIELEQSVQKLEDENLRLRADMQNLLRRHQKEKTDSLKFANEKLMHDVLPVLDSFDKAALSEDEDLEAYKKGVTLVREQLVDALKQHGLEGFVSAGEGFDPEKHQGIQRIDDESVDSETVKDEFQKGYSLNGRLLRPAMVSVLVPKK